MLFYVHSTYTTQELIKPLLELHSNHVSFWQQSGVQIHGKGQRGRFWQSDFGNVYITGHFFNKNNLLPGQISITVGVALAHMLETLRTNQEISLKWPNDLLINGQKCGGILIEKYSDHSYLIGVGININSHPENAENPATHLNLYGNFNFWNISLLAQSSIAKTLENLAPPSSALQAATLRGNPSDLWIDKSLAKSIHDNMNFSDIQKQWWNFAKRSAHQWVTNKPINGEVIGIDQQGQLLIAKPDGTVQALYNRL